MLIETWEPASGVTRGIFLLRGAIKQAQEVTDIVKKIEKRLDDLPVPKLVGSDIDWNAEESDLTPMPSQSSQSTTVSEASEVAGGRKPKRARVPSESVGTRKSTRARPANPRS